MTVDIRTGEEEGEHPLLNRAVKSSEATRGEGDKARERDIYVHDSTIIPPPTEGDCKELLRQQLDRDTVEHKQKSKRSSGNRSEREKKSQIK